MEDKINLVKLSDEALPLSAVKSEGTPIVGASTTAIVIGDPHFRQDDLENTAAMCEQIIAYCRQYKPNFIVCLGDILDTHNVGHAGPHRRACRFLWQLSQIAKLYIIMGNHDMSSNRDFMSQMHFFSPFEWLPNVVLVDTPKVVHIDTHRFAFIPYVFPGRFHEALSILNSSDTVHSQESSYKAIFAHQEFKGVKMGAIISEDGDPWPKDASLIISGHIHQYQKPQANIHYVGTPRQNGWGDTTDKSVSLYTFSASAIEEKRLMLNLRKKILLTMSVKEALVFVPPTNTQIKLKVTGTVAEIKAFKQTAEKSLKLAGVNVQVSIEGPAIAEVRTSKSLQAGQSKPSLNFTELLLERLKGKPHLIPYAKQLTC